jgi:hypothetical protein
MAYTPTGGDICFAGTNKDGSKFMVKKLHTAFFSTTMFYHDGAKRSVGKSESMPGAQDMMIANANENHHRVLCAFDTKASKTFASYASLEALYDALFNPTLRTLPPTLHNTAYEIISDLRPCWPHFDVEWTDAENGARDEKQTLSTLVDFIISHMKHCYPFACSSLSKDDLRVCRSRKQEKKRSFHMTITGKVAFENNAEHLNAFVQSLYRKAVLEIVENNNNRRDALVSIFFDRKHPCYKRITSGGGWIVDDRIYSKNRQFRCPGSVKLEDPSRGLYPYNIDSGAELCGGNDIPFDVWKDHLVCSVPTDLPRLYVLSATQTMKDLMKIKPTSIHSVEQRAMDDFYDITAPPAMRVTPTELATRSTALAASRIVATSKKRTPLDAALPDNTSKRTESLPDRDDELSNSLSAFRNSISN